MKFVWLLDLALVGVVGFFMALAPYLKVEESFNLQAVHDILNYGVFPIETLQSYDHITFPGVVPRTFIGSLLLAGVVKLIDSAYIIVTGSSLLEDGELGQLNVQLIVRAVLGLANIAGLISMRRSLNKIVFAEKKSSLKGLTGFFFSLLLLSQFHLNFYSTRTLPNFIALPFVTYSLSKLVVGDMSGLTWLGLTGIIFRLEIGIFGGVIALVSSLVFGQSNIFTNTFLLVAGTLVGVVLTAGIDSYFWGHWLVPEFEGFKFNIVHGQSVNWGVEPYRAYFTKYITNFFRPPHVTVLSLLGFFTDPAYDGKPIEVTEDQKLVISHPARHSLRILYLASLIYVALMSFQPHKEWRFIVYVIPVFTLLAANGLTALFHKRGTSLAHKLLLVILLASFIISSVLSFFMAYISSYNYPGGAAIGYLNTYIENNAPKSPVIVHMDVASCMTGITKFTELHNELAEFDKTENLQKLSEKWNDISYLITLVDMAQPQSDELVVYDPAHWETLTVIPAFVGVNAPLFLLNIHRIYADASYRKIVLAEIWRDLKQGRVDTIELLLQRAVHLRDFIYVYKRTAEDAMPLIIEEKQDEITREEEVVIAGCEEPPLEDLDPEILKEEINEQIDQLEQEVEQKFVDRDFPSVQS